MSMVIVILFLLDSLFLHSFKKYLLSTYYMPDTVLGAQI